MAEVRDKYHVAINSKGYMLRGAPGQVAYSRSIIPSQVERMAISDIAYSDFAGQGLFYLAQIDWNAGTKAEKKWRDDAKYWYSTNIDTYSEQGVIKLEKELTLENDFAEIMIHGGSFEVNNVTSEYIGGEVDGNGNIKIYKKGANWDDIAGTDFATTQTKCTQLIGHKNLLYALTYGTGSTDVVASYNGSAWTDHSAAIITASTMSSMVGAHCSCEIANTLYIFVYKAGELSLMSTADNGSTWVEKEHWTTNKVPNACAAYDGKIYYMLAETTGQELRVFDPSDSTDTTIKTFKGGDADSWGCGDKYLVVYGGKLIITIPATKIYEYDGDTLSEIYSKDDDKNDITGYLAEGILTYGATEYDNRLHWGNLIYDGEVFYNWKRPNGDSSSQYMWLLYVAHNNVKRMIDSSDRSKIWYDTSTYKTTLANNFLVFNEMAPVSKLDKLLHSATIIFDKMATGQSIKIEYSTDNRETWTTLGTRSYSATDSTTKKEWIIPSSVIFNKIWWKISLDGSATTPKLRDFIMAYKPMPDYKNRWSMRLNFSESVKLLNKQQEQRTGQELNSELWNEKVTKQTVVFEDIDYIKCDLVSAMAATDTSALVDSTQRFPRQGRIRAISGSVAEEMTYTSARTNKLLGISRAKRGTTARAYSAAQELNNAYDVYIEDIKSEVNFTDEKKTEHIAQVLLIES